MRRVISILAGTLLLAASGCDIPKALTRVAYAQVGAEGIAVSFYPRSGHSSDADDDGFMSSVLELGGIVAPLFGSFF